MQEFLPESILEYFSPAPFIVIESSLAGRSPELVTQAGLQGKQLCIVCDANTHAALGKRIHAELGAQLLILDGTPHADDKTVALIRSQPCDAYIAVGGGTISDLCKYASYLDGKPYLVFPTAPSMNGYLSANASITTHGHKQTFAAQLPLAVFCDLSVIAAAPHRLILSGLGDSLCRSTAQADWLLSHLLLDTPYNSEPFDWLKPYENELYLHADKLTSGDNEVIHLLMLTLLVSGLGMVFAKGSFPASQGEHLIAHTMEMQHGSKLPMTYHGEQIGVTTLSMAKIQQDLLSRPLVPVARNKEQEKAAIEAYFNEELRTSVWQSYEPKIIPNMLEEIHTRLLNSEQEIREKISSIILPVAQLEKVLQRAGARCEAKSLGWPENDYNQALRHARFIRNRFTFLDLLG